MGWGNDGVCGNSSGGGSDETGVWLPMRATANGATREFSVSRGNSRTKRGEVNWCRVDCFCVADWKARIPPSEWQLLEPRSGGAIDLSSLLLVIRKRVVCRCATMFATSGWAGRGVDRLVNSDRNADLLPPGRVSNGERGQKRGTRVAQNGSIAVSAERERLFLFLERKLVRRLSVSSSPRQAGRENGNATAEHFRFPLE